MKKRFLIWDNPCQAIYMLMGILLVFGGINVFSASFVTAYDAYGNGLHYLLRYFIYAVISFTGMWGVRRVGYKFWLNSYWLWIIYIVVLGLLLLVEFIGEANKGAARWLYLGPVSIQPSEAAKLAVIMLAASYLGNLMRQRKTISLFGGQGAVVAIATLVYGGLVYIQPDLGTAAIIIGLMMGVFIIAGIAQWQVAGILGIGLVGAVTATVLSPYRLERVKVWFDPWLDARGAGYQMVQSLLAIGSGGWIGTNWGQGSSKFSYLPESHTDFAFAVFCQENGFVGALLLILVFAVLAAAFFRITFRTRDQQGFLLAGGITFLIIGQAVANMAMVCGIFPVIGVPLIFISYGGSSMFVSMLAIGLLLSVYDEEVKQEQLEAVPPEVRRDDLRVVGGGRQRQ